MKKKWLKSNGFTLAELLIVVAIIAVLVAISIPIFTTQLEKAREATDLSDVRSAYAEVMMAAITDDTTATYSKDSTQTIHKSNGLYSVNVYPLHQEQNDWQGTMDLNVGGVSSSDSSHWIGTPQAKGSCEVSYNPQGDAVTFNWLGKSNAGSGTDTGNGGNNNGGNGSSTGGGSTPAPTPNPGNGGGTTGGGDNNQGNGNTESTETPATNPATESPSETPSTKPGNNTPDTKQTESTDKTPETESKSEDELSKTTIVLSPFGYYNWPPQPSNNGSTRYNVNITKGQVIYYNGSYYICAADTYSEEYYNEWSYRTPVTLASWDVFVKVTNTIHDSSEVIIDPSKYNTPTVTNLHVGDLFKCDDGQVYLFKGGDNKQTDPSVNDSSTDWIKLSSKTPQTWDSTGNQLES